MAYLIDWQTAIDSMDAIVAQVNGGTTCGSDGILTLNSGASAPSGALFNALWPLTSVGQQDMTVDFTAAFDANPANGTVQMAGLGDGERGVWVGFNGTSMGLRLLSGGQAQVYALKVTQPALSDGTLTLSVNGGQLVFPVPAGQTAVATLRQIALSQAVINANMKAAVVNDTVWMASLQPGPFLQILERVARRA